MPLEFTVQVHVATSAIREREIRRRITTMELQWIVAATGFFVGDR